MCPERKSGILLHISSLPCEFGIGDLGPCADQFVDFLRNARQGAWQVLPINPTDSINEHSPYSSSSAFAGNILFISPQRLADDGLLDQNDLSAKENFPVDFVDYDAVVLYKERLFELAYDHFISKEDVHQRHEIPFNEFCNDNSYWVNDYALFATIKRENKGIIWTDWSEPLRNREANALREFEEKHSREVTKVKFLQYLFFRQWEQLKDYCTLNGVRLIGDMAIYMAFDSADVWAHRENYKLDGNSKPTVVAGVPPDYFSPTGQRWGYPVYNWEKMHENKYYWWIERFKFNFQLFDTVRVDHFRGLVQCWEIPSNEPTAVKGKWVDVPTVDFLKTLERVFLKPLAIIAEDLGHITDDVRGVMKEFDIPGMKVLLFAFNDGLKDHPYLPHNYQPQCVVYTGTHDNNTVLGWFEHEATQKELDNVQKYIGKEVSSESINWDLIHLAFDSNARLAMIPLQDALQLGSEGRMNKPATMGKNWRWRCSSEMLSSQLIEKLSDVTAAAGRGSLLTFDH